MARTHSMSVLLPSRACTLAQKVSRATPTPAWRPLACPRAGGVRRSLRSPLRLASDQGRVVERVHRSAHQARYHPRIIGTIDYVASTVIPQCGPWVVPTRWRRGRQDERRLLRVRVHDRAEPRPEHLRSLFTIKADGAASILVGLTTQRLESKNDELASTYKAAINSFKS